MQKNERSTGSGETARGRITPGAWRRQPRPKLPKAAIFLTRAGVRLCWMSCCATTAKPLIAMNDSRSR